MLLISHRGNINGPNKLEENNPSYVMDAIYKGFDAEVDAWHLPDGMYLGHDYPKYKVPYSFFINEHLWVHCKNNEAIVYLSVDERLHVFTHTEGISLTSKGFLFTYPGLLLNSKSIAVMPELCDHWDIKDAYGVCTDYVLNYK